MAVYYDREFRSDEEIIEIYKNYLRSNGEKVDPKFLEYVFSSGISDSAKFKVYKEFEYRIAATASISFGLTSSSHYTDSYVKSVSVKVDTDSFNRARITATPDRRYYTERESDSETFYCYGRPVSATYTYDEATGKGTYSGNNKKTSEGILNCEYYKDRSMYSTKMLSFYMDCPIPEKSKMKEAMISREALSGLISEKKRELGSRIEKYGNTVDNIGLSGIRYSSYDDTSEITVVSISGYTIKTFYNGMTVECKFDPWGEQDGYLAKGFPVSKDLLNKLNDDLAVALRPLEIRRLINIVQLAFAAAVNIFSIVTAIAGLTRWAGCIGRIVVGGFFAFVTVFRIRDMTSALNANATKVIRDENGTVEREANSIKSLFDPFGGSDEYLFFLSPVLSWLVPLALTIISILFF